MMLTWSFWRREEEGIVFGCLDGRRDAKWGDYPFIGKEFWKEMKHHDEKTQTLGDFHPAVALFFRRGGEEKTSSDPLLFRPPEVMGAEKEGGEKEEGEGRI